MENQKRLDLDFLSAVADYLAFNGFDDEHGELLTLPEDGIIGLYHTTVGDNEDPIQISYDRGKELYTTEYTGDKFYLFISEKYSVEDFIENFKGGVGADSLYSERPLDDDEWAELTQLLEGKDLTPKGLELIKDDLITLMEEARVSSDWEIQDSTGKAIFSFSPKNFVYRLEVCDSRNRPELRYHQVIGSAYSSIQDAYSEAVKIFEAAKKEFGELTFVKEQFVTRDYVLNVSKGDRILVGRLFEGLGNGSDLFQVEICKMVLK